MKTFKTVQIVITDKIAVLKFNRPEQLNAMNRQMMDEIIEAIHLINGNSAPDSTEWQISNLKKRGISEGLNISVSSIRMAQVLSLSTH